MSVIMLLLNAKSDYFDEGDCSILDAGGNMAGPISTNSLMSHY